ncbi:MAG: GtrA family protein [Lachnospiraceae bacterium]|jgi:putative flippase GtrA|nr:GtrA family protein [Lachnospiraceae bacterium]
MDKEELSKEDRRKKLLAQIIKFGLVGGTSFIIDFIITLIVSKICRVFGMNVATAATVGSVFGFCISLVYNYFMSMKFVFERRDDMNRGKEFTIFLLLSLIGMGINSAIMYFGVLMAENMLPAITEEYPSYVTAAVKMFATGVVMVYNFISRKMTLEKK